MKSKKNITRFTYKDHDFQGWRVAYTRAGEKFVRYFSDKRCGGVKKALRQAGMHLERLKKILDPIPPQTSIKKGAKKIKGVHRSTSPGGKGSSCLACWVASWNEGGVRHTKKFSIAKYGERLAKALAIKARREACSKIKKSEILRLIGQARRL